MSNQQPQGMTPEEWEERIRHLSLEELNDISRLVTVFHAMTTIGTENADARAFKEMLIAEKNAGTLTDGKLRGYIAAMEETLKTPGITFSPAEAALAEIDCDFQTLETTLDEFFNDTLPPYREQIGELDTALLMDLDAATDIYNVFSENIRERLNKAKAEMK